MSDALCFLKPTIARRQTIGDIPRRTARRLPNKVAIICGSVRWTYSQFNEEIDRVSNGLIAHGIQPQDKVAILSRNSHAFAAIRFAVARMGAVLVPVNFMLSTKDVAYVLRHSESKVLFTDREFSETATAAASEAGVSDLVWLPGEEDSDPLEGMKSYFDLALHSAEPVEIDIPSDSVVQIVYTSGTESSPKGAMLTHDAVISQYVSVIVAGQFEENDSMLHALPLFHCAQLDAFFGPAVYVGMTNVIVGKASPGNVMDQLREHEIKSFFAPPTVWISLLRSIDIEEKELPLLRKCYYGASIMPVAVLQEMQQRLPDVRLWNFYGQTEIAPTAAILQPEDQLQKAGSCGKPVMNVETKLIDDAGNDVPVGTIGEIVHRSPQLMIGYYRDPERTAAAFSGDWFHSGDLGVFDQDGYLTVVDRMKDMIKTGGENVASREVEETIYRLDGISEVAVVGLPDPLWIEAVTAVIVLKPGHNLTSADVLKHCKAQMSHFKVPKRIFFVDGLPRNPSGKLLKREVRRQYENA